MDFIYIILILLILNYINTPRGYYSVLCCGGLGNRLRMILSCYKYSKQINKKLKVYWIPDESISYALFADVFNPIKNITFVYNYNNEPLDYRSDINCSALNKITNYNDMYKYLTPNNTINNRIDYLKKKINNKYISLHIRRTDHSSLAKNNKNFVTDDNYINKYPNYNIYLATDNRETQDKFIKLYGKRLIVNKLIDNNNSDLRKTSLKDSVIDIYMCVYSKVFKSSGFSSFSETIYCLRKV